MERSDKIDQLATALSKAVAKIPNVPKKGKNPHFRSTYMVLDDVLDAVKPVLGEHGLTIMQFPISKDGDVGVETMLCHSSGQWVSSVLAIKPSKPVAQEVGSIITYFRRYGIGSILNIATEDDDDGNNASPKPSKPPVDDHYMGSPSQKADLSKLFLKHGIDTPKDMKELSDLFIEKKMNLDQIEAYLRGDMVK